MAFRPAERSLLLRTQGIGPTVVNRLEDAGIDSLERLAKLGVGCAVEIVGRQMCGSGWENRRRALERAVEAWKGARGDAK